MVIRAARHFISVALIVLCTAAFAQTDIRVAEAERLAYGLIQSGKYAAALELVDTLQQDGHNQTAVVFYRQFTCFARRRSSD